jgi:SAM-dependent methyltransferase
MNCDPIAYWYRLFEYMIFGSALQRRRLEFLNEVADARRVLILGDGDGRFTAEFVNRNSSALVDSIDLSRKMLALAKRHAAGATNVRFRLGDARTIDLTGPFDLVVTHFFLDCFTEADLEPLVARISAQCTPGARWIVSDFSLPPSGFGRSAAKALIRFMYFFFRVLTGLTVIRLPNYTAVLELHGFRLEERRTVWDRFLVSELWAAS